MTMETAQYICEFFFENFKHFLELLILCRALSSSHTIKNIFKKGEGDD